MNNGVSLTGGCGAASARPETEEQAAERRTVFTHKFHEVINIIDTFASYLDVWDQLKFRAVSRTWNKTMGTLIDPNILEAVKNRLMLPKKIFDAKIAIENAQNHPSYQWRGVVPAFTTYMNTRRIEVLTRNLEDLQSLLTSNRENLYSKFVYDRAESVFMNILGGSQIYNCLEEIAETEIDRRISDFIAFKQEKLLVLKIKSSDGFGILITYNSKNTIDPSYKDYSEALSRFLEETSDLLPPRSTPPLTTSVKLAESLSLDIDLLERSEDKANDFITTRSLWIKNNKQKTNVIFWENKKNNGFCTFSFKDPELSKKIITIGRLLVAKAASAGPASATPASLASATPASLASAAIAAMRTRAAITRGAMAAATSAAAYW